MAPRPAECAPVPNGPRATVFSRGGCFWLSRAFFATSPPFSTLLPAQSYLPASLSSLFKYPWAGPFAPSRSRFAAHSAVHIRGRPTLLFTPPPTAVGPVGARGIHGRHEPLHHPQRERPCARGRRAHPIGVRARGAEAALNLTLGPGCLGGPHGPWVMFDC